MANFKRHHLNLLLVGLLVFVACLLGYQVGRQVPPLVAPIYIDSASAQADGGSMRIALRDSQGRRYAIGVRGSLLPQYEFVYVQPWSAFLPVPIPIAKKSPEEKSLLAALETWRKQLDGAQPGAELLGQIAGVIRNHSE